MNQEREQSLRSHNGLANVAMALGGERRKRPRVALHWPLRLFRQPEGQSIESTTENLSSEGFYCITKGPFKPGERLQCEIVMPATFGLESPIVIECHVTIRRVEYLGREFGLGCHIEDYSLTRVCRHLRD